MRSRSKRQLANDDDHEKHRIQSIARVLREGLSWNTLEKQLEPHIANNSLTVLQAI